MPLAPSSMVVVRSPVWSWMRRTIAMYRSSNRWQRMSTGIVAAKVSSASGACNATSTPKIAATCTRISTKKMAPKPMNRRITLRSVIARESSWPDCQRSWNPTSSRCSCA